MHELSIAQNILEIVREYVSEERAAEVQAVKVRVGELSGVVAESLEFCFSAIISDTALKHATLKIESVPAQLHCSACGHSCSPDGLLFRCPGCGAGSIQLVSGTELQVIEIELADTATEAL